MVFIFYSRLGTKCWKEKEREERKKKKGGGGSNDVYVVNTRGGKAGRGVVWNLRWFALAICLFCHVVTVGKRFPPMIEIGKAFFFFGGGRDLRFASRGRTPPTVHQVMAGGR